MTFKEIVKSIDKKEWKFITLIIIIISILIISPYIAGTIKKSADEYYTGLYSYRNMDRAVYYSYIEQVKQKNILFGNLYTSENPEKGTLNIFWLGAGIFGKIFHLSNKLTFEILKILLAPFLIIIAYFLSALVFKEKIKRKISLIFILFASGWGGIVFNSLQKISIEKWHVGMLDMALGEAFSFLALMHSPHFIASVTLLLTTLMLAFLAIENNNIKYGILSGISALLLFQFHPFNIPTIIFVLGAYILILSAIRKNVLFRNLKHVLLIILISSPSILYYIFLMANDKITYQKSLQNICLTPSLIITICGYGFLLIGALISSVFLIRNKKIKNIEIFMIVWAIVQFILIYSPVNFQRRMTEGLNFPLIILTLILIFKIFKKKDKIIKKLKKNYIILFFIFIIFFGFTNLVVFADLITGPKNDIDHSFIYPEKKKIEAMEWLKKNTNENDIITASYINNNFIPAITGRHVFVGHGIETINFKKKYISNKALFDKNLSDKYIENFLNENNINYIFFSLFEKHALKWNPQEKKYLEKVFDNKEVQIYKFIK